MPGPAAAYGSQHEIQLYDVTSSNVLWRKDRTGGGEWVHLKDANNMAMSGLSFENTLVGTRWAVSVFLWGAKFTQVSAQRCLRVIPIG